MLAKVKREMVRAELIAFLETVLRDLKEGKLTVAETTVDLPEKALVEVEIEPKKGKQTVELEIKWELAATGSPTNPEVGTEE